MSLFTEVVKQKSRGNKVAFWDSSYGAFAALNGIDSKAYNPNILRQIQLQRLKIQSLSNSRLQEANSFIRSLPQYNMDETQNMAANQIFTRIATILNSPFQKGDALTREKSDRLAQLNTLLQTIKVDLPISPVIIKALSDNVILTKDSGLYAYRAEKAKLFEEIVAAYFTGANLGSAITTGSWGKITDNNRQLVTDVYAFLTTGETKTMKGKYVSYEKTGYWKADIARAKEGLAIDVASNLEQFIQEMQILNNQTNIGISIDDELASTLDTISSLRVQVKSGMGQSILNTNNRNAITLGEFGDFRLNLLSEFYELDKANNYQFLYKNPKESQTLTAYANYLLSTNIAKTTLLTDNNIYFTEHGFESVYDWVNNRNVYLRFIQGTKLNAQLLTSRRRYNFFSV